MIKLISKYLLEKLNIITGAFRSKKTFWSDPDTNFVYMNMSEAEIERFKKHISNLNRRDFVEIVREEQGVK